MTGWKTVTGTVGYALCTGLAGLFPKYADMLTLAANAIFAPLGVLGIAHKIEKSGQ